MNISNHISALIDRYKLIATRRILMHRICARHPTLRCDPTAIFDYGYRDLEDIKIGRNVTVAPFAEIIVFRHSKYSSILGELTLHDQSVISTGVNIRAAGGAISIGKGTAIAQYAVLVAANHVIKPGEARIHVHWDETRTGVFVGDNVWVGANCVLLPGCKIGDNSIIAAGSVVRGEVPPNELWAGVPAKRIKSV